MRKTIATTTGFIIASLTSIPTYAADYEEPNYGFVPDVVRYEGDRWTGFYTGVHGGFGLLDTSDDAGFVNENMRTPIGGAQVGYNHQVGSFVFGLEADFSLVNVDQDNDAPDADIQSDWATSLRARVGYAFDQVMVFATAGGVLGHASSTSNTTGLSDDHVHKGYALGAGVEVFVSDDWTIGAEYLRYEYGAETYVFTNSFESEGNFDAVRIRASYSF